MDKIDRLEKRIEQLEKELRHKEDKKTNRERLARGLLIHWDESKRIDFEEKYSKENMGSEYERFDLKRVVEGASGKSPAKRLKHWNEFYIELRDFANQQNDNPFWDELLFLAKTAVDMYSNKVVKHIIENGEYINEGGAPGLTKDQKRVIKTEWLKYRQDPKNYHESGPHKGTANKQKFYSRMANEFSFPEPPGQKESDRTKPIERYVKKLR